MDRCSNEWKSARSHGAVDLGRSGAPPGRWCRRAGSGWRRRDGAAARVAMRFLLAAAVLADPARAQIDDLTHRLADISIEELLEIEVVSLGRRNQRPVDVAAAVYVITADEIRRSTANSVPELLRMVPGVEVARVQSNRWAISIRGANTVVANKLQVLIDGRSVYTPARSGVFWELHDLLPDDIARIEVIRGPGASLWGANAVNGVINIVTRSARDTQGGLLVTQAGEGERAQFGLRQGFALDDNTHARVSLRGITREPGERGPGEPNEDTQRQLRAGLRVDRRDGFDTFMLSAEYVRDRSGDTALFPYIEPTTQVLPYTQKGENAHVLGRWQHRFDSGDELQAQAYFFRHDLATYGGVGDTSAVIDFDLQYRRTRGEHDLIFGAGYRRARQAFRSGVGIAVVPETGHFELHSAFVQDEIALAGPALKLTVGSKFEHHTFSGFNAQPNARVLWTPVQGQVLWASAARAVRSPLFWERNSRITFGENLPPGSASNPTPVPLDIEGVGSTSIRPERLDAFELGWRAQWSPLLWSDLALYHNRYRDLVAFKVDPSLIAPADGGLVLAIPAANDRRGRITGAELNVSWRPSTALRLDAMAVRQKLASRGSDDSELSLRQGFEYLSPRYYAMLRASAEISEAVRSSIQVRRVGALRTTPGVADGSVAAYTAVDLKVAWRARRDVELALTGVNLADSAHREFTGDFPRTPGSLYGRGAFATLRWGF